ncbi:hypothetical protein AVEN_34578-1 [Araneus ventricosus]|uniref:Uncharacterized protein n=1 Tax=Araneus ventricosus TaxID=182803 RepID=A0A4Y2AZ59_ARAVE|nr:hypothetical protein AVEN_34578-1 [Araneus ventricosus]
MDCGQTMRVTPEPEIYSSNIHATLICRLFTHHGLFNVHQAHMHGGSSVEPSLKPGILRPRSRDSRPSRSNIEYTPEYALVGETPCAYIQLSTF